MLVRPVRQRREDRGEASTEFGDLALQAASLTSGAHASHTYVLTGPEPTSPRRRVEILGHVLDEPLDLVEQSYDQARQQLLQFMPEAVAEGTLALLGQPTSEERRASPDVQRVSRPTAEFLRRLG